MNNRNFYYKSKYGGLICSNYERDFGETPLTEDQYAKEVWSLGFCFYQKPSETPMKVGSFIFTGYKFVNVPVIFSE